MVCRYREFDCPQRTGIIHHELRVYVSDRQDRDGLEAEEEHGGGDEVTLALYEVCESPKGAACGRLAIGGPLQERQRLREEREGNLLNQMSSLSLKQRAFQYASAFGKDLPKQQASAFGHSSPRPHLWLGPNAAGGTAAGTGSSAGGQSPRGASSAGR